MCPFDYTAVAGSGKVGSVNQVNLNNLSTKVICNKTVGLAINLCRKLATYAKDLTFSRMCSRLVDVGDDMILFC